MNDIKKYEKLTVIKLKSWKVLRTPATLEQVAMILNDKQKDYIVIDWVGFNRLTDAQEFFEYVPTDLDCFILGQPKQVQEELRKILAEREEKWLKTNWPTHLRNIYEWRFLLNSTTQNDR